ncbi:hypothetical protein MGYG_05358 [Nannizzia gypsea CBS 118893]|uniref:Uncharacterized protein n=1 Tax=Arthroderma gypseum (strain ATCC MYA-4604 / CBS 118893) TaxID=535722 RepID=E4UVN4_ARTGP|nr:hypothetical protein MGYG_05358 [Nannizzia gypsea CBS 118893]EFR02361.1 hypothetical protein MGYG_05358 [Nannizzia gypsea CBS 118893]
MSSEFAFREVIKTPNSSASMHTSTHYHKGRGVLADTGQEEGDTSFGSALGVIIDSSNHDALFEGAISNSAAKKRNKSFPL